MPDLKITQLPEAAALTGVEPLPIVQGGTTVQTTTQEIANLAAGGGPRIYAVDLQAVTTVFTNNNNMDLFDLQGTQVPSDDVHFVNTVPEVTPGHFVFDTDGVYRVIVTLKIQPTDFTWPNDVTVFALTQSGFTVIRASRVADGSGGEPFLEPEVGFTAMFVVNKDVGEEMTLGVIMQNYSTTGEEFQINALAVTIERIGEFLPPG